MWRKTFISASSRWFGNYIVKFERHYLLPEAEEGSEHIVKALHQSQKPLTSLQLWEELWDCGKYKDHEEMRRFLHQLVEVRYVVKIPGQNIETDTRVHVYALTHKTHLEDIN